MWRQDVGTYNMLINAVDIHFPRDHNDGVYQVTAYGKRPVRCEVHGEQDETPTPIVVHCADHNGTPTDSRFVVTYAHGTSILGTAVAHANAHAGGLEDDPVGSWIVNGWSNPGGAPTFARFAPGQYRVTFPGLIVTGGHANTGTRGDPRRYCHVASWFGTAVSVHCFDRVTNRFADSEFNVAIMA